MWAYKELHCSLYKHDFYRHSDKLTSHNPLQNTTKKKELQYFFKPASGLDYERVWAAACFRIWGGCVRSQTASLLKPALLSCYQT